LKGRERKERVTFLQRDANYHVGVSNLFPCIEYILLKPHHFSVAQNHIQGVYHIKGELHISHVQMKKFWEELIAYFPSYDMDSTENDASVVLSLRAFFAAVTSLPNRCLAPAGRYTDTQSDGKDL
jgi:hypothetical protein